MVHTHFIQTNVTSQATFYGKWLLYGGQNNWLDKRVTGYGERTILYEEKKFPNYPTILPITIY